MSEEGPVTRRDELETLLPFYLNGTLEGEELRRVEEWLAGGDPDAAAALAAAEAEFSATLDANESVRPPAGALSRFAAALEREAGPEPATAQPSWRARLWRRFAGMPAGVAWAVAGLALAALIVQAVVDRGAPRGYEFAGEDQSSEKLPFVLVVFDPDASMASVTGTLSGLGVAIAAGPLPGGMYRVAIPATDAAAFDRISAGIAASDTVERMVIGRRPADGP